MRNAKVLFVAGLMLAAQSGAAQAYKLDGAPTRGTGAETTPVATTVSSMPAPAPLPVKPARQHSYLVFFDFDQSNITPAGTSILHRAAVAIRTGGRLMRVKLTGHTDLSGTDPYDMVLSLKRADTVRAALVKLGVRATEMAVTGKGKREPLVQTKDGVREPQNRRVEIVLQ